MKKLNILCIILSFLILTSAFTVFADEAPVTEILIENTEQFLQFVQDCRLDSYSKNLSVKLSSDIDLTGHSFSGIPIFCGNFDGNGHTISGISLEYTGSNAGLFRYVTETAEISNLKASGTILPQGSASYVGGIAGSNAGTLKNCTFTGTVSGTDHIGGIAGINTQTGIIDNCSAEGVVFGNHFAGGIAGSNHGMIQDCKNYSLVNTESQQNKVDLSDVTIDALTGSESAGTVTDIGGIAGISSGFISRCENHGAIGYPRIGYNIGGIAGSQTGYITDCVNTATISGRKEIGGIAGQLEPVIAITYSTDTLQILQEQLSTLSASVDRAAANMRDTVSGVNQQLVLIQGQIRETVEALEALLRTDDSVPSPEVFTQAIETLQNGVRSIGGSLDSIYESMDNAEASLSGDIARISGTIAEMQQTLNSATENLGGSVSDHSDADTDQDLTAKIHRCQNNGLIHADLNGGGIVGAIAFESDLDPETDIEIFGDSTLNFAGAYRAVITDCENAAAVTVKKQYAGGIVGYATLGLVRNCSNTADLLCPNAVFVGGIAGRSSGIIRNCSAKCLVSGKEGAGGIAGQGKTVSDCLALCDVSASEKTGSVLGFADDLSQVSNNLYMLLPQDLGAIDGISYDTLAQALTMEEFLQLENLPEFFKTYTVTFVFPDSTTQPITLTTGELITQQQIPVLPELEGCKGHWLGLDSTRFFDSTIHSTYETKITTVQSQHLRKNGLPILLAEGAFQPDFHLEIASIQSGLAPEAVEGWSFANSGVTKLRYLPPENYQADALCVMTQESDGSWKKIPHTVSGSYLVFDIGIDTDTFCIAAVQNTPWGLYILAGAIFLAVSCVITAIAVKRKKAGKKHPADPTAEA